MKDVKVKQFDDQDQEMVDILRSIGMGRKVANVLIFLVSGAEARSIDIEHATGLRQPEVSLGLKQLIAEKWATMEQMENPSRGRPTRKYKLCVKFNDIIEQIEKRQKSDADETMQKLGRLKKIKK